MDHTGNDHEYAPFQLVTWDELFRQFKIMSQQTLFFLPVDYHLVTTQDESIGTVLMQKHLDRLVMKKIYVEPEYRRQGVARRIIQALKEVSDETGTVVQVNCKSPERQYSPELKSLFVSEGFEVDPDLGEDYFFWGGSEELEL